MREKDILGGKIKSLPISFHLGMPFKGLSSQRQVDFPRELMP